MRVGTINGDWIMAPQSSATNPSVHLFSPLKLSKRVHPDAFKNALIRCHSGISTMPVWLIIHEAFTRSPSVKSFSECLFILSASAEKHKKWWHVVATVFVSFSHTLTLDARKRDWSSSHKPREKKNFSPRIKSLLLRHVVEVHTTFSCAKKLLKFKVEFLFFRY